MKHCILIPCYNHAGTVAAVARAAQAHGPVLVVDDGSTEPMPEMPGCTVFQLKPNQGKGAALRAGFEKAAELGFTHAVTMDADGQHFAEDLPKFIAAFTAQPEALIVGVRDFFAAGCPTHRRRSNAISTFWFRVETDVRLGDTQCGFRCYPLSLVRRLKTRSGRYAYELEIMVRAAWVGAPLVAAPVKCTYEPEQLRRSHFRPVHDFLHITLMNVGLVFQSWFVPLTLRRAWSFGEKKTLWQTIKEFFTEHSEAPSRLAWAVGLGLFFGILPIYGFQIMVGAAVAHRLRLNKATLLLASHISIPPVVPFIIYGGMVLGHWLFTGQPLDIAPGGLTKSLTTAHFVEWVVGTIVLAVLAGLAGFIVTYILARVLRKK